MDGLEARIQHGVINGVPMIQCLCSHEEPENPLADPTSVCSDCGERMDRPAGWLIDPALTDPS